MRRLRDMRDAHISLVMGKISRGTLISLYCALVFLLCVRSWQQTWCNFVEDELKRGF